MTDAIPSGTAFGSATPSQGSCNGTTTVNCTLGMIASDGSGSISLVLTLPSAAGPVANTTTASFIESRPESGEQQQPSTVTVIPTAAIPALSWCGLLLLGLTVMVLGALRLRG